MNKEQQMVLEFHEQGGLWIGEKPSVPPIATRVLRCRLHLEEVYEAENEICQGNVENTAKELADILYVVYGTAVSFGIDMEEVFKEVHRSNMTKIGGIKREDGKILKPDTYQPANISPILKGQGL